MKYVSKKEQVNYLAGLSGQNLVYSLIGVGKGVKKVP